MKNVCDEVTVVVGAKVAALGFVDEKMNVYDPAPELSEKLAKSD